MWDFSEWDWVLPRLGFASLDWGLKILLLLEASGVRSLNSHTSLRICTDKFWQLQYLKKSGLPIARTWPFAKNQSQDLPEDFEHCVVKSSRGSQGFGVFSLRRQQWPEIRDFLRNEAFDGFVQQYVAGPEYRVLVLGDEVLACVRKESSDFRKNLSLSEHNRGVDCPLPAAFHKLVWKAKEALQLDFCGVDLIDSPSGALILEVNAFPGFQKTLRGNQQSLKIGFQKFFANKV